MIITLRDVTKATVEIIDKSDIYHYEFGPGPRMVCKVEVKNMHLSEHFLYLENDGTCAVIDNRLYSYLEVM